MGKNKIFIEKMNKLEETIDLFMSDKLDDGIQEFEEGFSVIECEIFEYISERERNDFYYRLDLIGALLRKEIDIFTFKDQIFAKRNIEKTMKCVEIGTPDLMDKDFDIEEYNLDNKKIKVYFDLNVMNMFKDDSEIKSLVLNSKDKYVYLYSPNHICEIARMDSTDRIDLITEITDNIIILPKDSKLVIHKEKPEASLRRINMRPKYNKEHEEQWLHQEKHIRNIYFNKFNDEMHKKGIGDKSDIFEKYKEEVDYILMKLGYGSLDSIKKDISQNELKEGQLDDYLRELFIIMDILAFKMDNGDRKIKSAVYDLEHIKYALKCDCFVTRDRRLYFRTKEIYKFMGIDTVVLLAEEYFNQIGQE